MYTNAGKRMSFETASIKFSHDLIILLEVLSEVARHMGGLDTTLTDFIKQQGPGASFEPEEFLEFALQGAPDAARIIVHARYQAVMDSSDKIRSTPAWQETDDCGRESLRKEAFYEFVRDAEANGLMSKEELKWLLTGVAISETGDMGNFLKLVEGKDDVSGYKN